MLLARGDGDIRILKKRYSEGWSQSSVVGITVGLSLLAIITVACATYAYLERKRLRSFRGLVSSAHPALQRERRSLSWLSPMQSLRLQPVAEEPEYKTLNSRPTDDLGQSKIGSAKNSLVPTWYTNPPSTKPPTSRVSTPAQSDTMSRYAHSTYRSGSRVPSFTSVDATSQIIRPSPARLKTCSRHISVQFLQVEDELMASPVRSIMSKGGADKAWQAPLSLKQSLGYRHRSLPQLQSMSEREYRNSRPMVRDLAWIEDEIVRLKRRRGLST